MAIIFRSDDGTRWGTGQGSDLSAAQIDVNFWELYSAITALQDHSANGAFIDFFSVTGNNLYVHMTDHSVLGPYTLPVAQWNFVGPWQPETAYAVMDTFNGPDGGLYVVIYAHTSDTTFDAGANDGFGHQFYTPLIAPTESLMPAGGTVGQRLAKIDSTDYNAEWVDEPTSLAVFAGGTVSANEVLFRYVVTKNMTLLAGLPDTQAANATDTTVGTSFNILKNGASAGTIDFLASPAGSFDVTFTADVTLVPGDVVSITAPSSPDPHQTDISITLVAVLTA